MEAAAPAAGSDDAPAALFDEVDRIVADWRRERPDLDVEPLEVFSRVTRLARHLDRARRVAFTAHELETWEFDVLSALRREGDPYELSPGGLVTATLVTSGTMTNRIDRLESRGLVERRRSPDDRRGVVVRLTHAGRERVDAAMNDLLAQETRMLGALAPRRRPELAALLREVIAPFDDHGGRD
ncbi:MarR family transcriptional regulator [Xylanimonas allomyrinae]|uniref:MarR family transcriptional regulator n=1 Tax=Xylanimonas allomyrinae TaxID=2509459 RepID=A0A4P6ERU7_9MICO|nr:MarR family transcriptional regulator [Xylanimonas allomyrinae]QAY64653.1 MarR family transcriptional regulator [Xylanimonas allomyrinae]